MSDNVEVINPQGPGSTVAPNSSATAQQAKTAAAANAKAQGQSSKCGNGGCGSEVPGQCCEWMSKFNIAMQRAMRPYSNSCGSCNGSGEKGGGACQACNGTGIEGSTGGALSQNVTLVRLEYITELSQLDDYARKWGFLSADDMISKVGLIFNTHWRYKFVPFLIKAYITIDLDTLNSCYKAEGYIVNIIPSLLNEQNPLILETQLSEEEAERATTIYSYSSAYRTSQATPIYYYNNIYYALQSDLREEFPEEGF